MVVQGEFMVAFIRYLAKRIVRIISFLLFGFLPIKRNRVLLLNNLSHNYSCNLKAIAEYLLSNFSVNEFQIIYSVKDLSKEIYLKDKGIILVKFNSLKYFYYLMTSKIVVSNSGGYSYIHKRSNQVIINTHHGGGAYKYAGADMFGHSFFFVKDLQLTKRNTDIFLSTNKKFTEVISRASYLPKHIFWEIGMPRNDKLLKPNNAEINKIREKIGLSKNEKLVLYAPTYRKENDNYFKKSISLDYGIDSNRVCNALAKRFGGEWKFALRLHPCITDKSAYLIDNVIDLSDYEDMQDLLLVADVLINDFSSSFWDFMLTGKPCFMYAIDLQKYIETTKVYTPVEEWPFPKSTNNNELEKNILEFDESKYQEDCKNHYNKLGGCESGRATELVCELIDSIVNNKKYSLNNLPQFD